MRLTKTELSALVRFEVAARFSADGTPIGDDLTRLYYSTDRSKAVAVDVVRSLLDKGAMVRPAAGQYMVTALGRKAIERALKKGG